MSNFRILILVLLVVVLAVLGLIYVNISGRMDVIQKQGQMAAAPAVPTSAASPSYLPVPMPSSNTPMQPAVVQDPVVKEELAHATAELERIKKENEELRKRRALAEEERAILERRNLEKGDPHLQWLNDIKDAEQVGRVTEYYRDANLVLFEAIGKPKLEMRQELGIRRRGSIFASLIIDGMDSDGRVYQCYVKRNTLFDSNDKEPIKPGDEVIIPPASWQDNLPEVGSAGNAAPAGPSAPAPASKPVMIPMEP